MKLERCEVVLNFRETDRERRGSLSGQYPHVVKDKIYWQLADPSEIAYAFKDGDSYKKPSENVILSNSLASQNLECFMTTDQMFHTMKDIRRLVGIMSVDHLQKQKLNIRKCINTYIRD